MSKVFSCLFPVISLGIIKHVPVVSPSFPGFPRFPQVSKVALVVPRMEGMLPCASPAKVAGKDPGLRRSWSFLEVFRGMVLEEFNGHRGMDLIPINTIFSGMNIHLPAILMFTRGTRF